MERVLGVVRLGGVLGRLPGDRVVPPQVALVGPRDVRAGTAHHQHGADIGASRHRLVHERLERHRGAAPKLAVGGDDDPGVAIQDPASQRVDREPGETTVCRAPSRAQASVATTVSEIIGMWIATRSPLRTPSSISELVALQTSSLSWV